MNTTLRIVIVILCVIALYYLVVMLARGFAQEEVGLAPASSVETITGARSAAQAPSAG